MDSGLLEAMLRLLDVYAGRRDLQEAFPEVVSKDYRRLLEWADGVVQKKWEDGAYSVLKPYGIQYESLLRVGDICDPALDKWLRDFSERPPVGSVEFGSLRRLRPISGDKFGWDRGLTSLSSGSDVPSSARTSNPLVSAVIPYRDRPSHLDRVLAGYEMQSYRNLEIIVVDDGSDSKEELRRVMRGRSVACYTSPYRHYFFRLAFCRNIGAARAQGDILVFNDVDVIPESEAVARMVKIHSENDVVMVGNVMRIEGGLDAVKDVKKNTADKLRSVSTPWVAHYDQFGPLQWSTGGLVCRSEFWWAFLGGFCSFRRSNFLSLLGWDPEYSGWGYEDTDMGYRILRHGMTMAFFDDIIGFHIDHPPAQALVITGLRNQDYFLRKFPELRSSPVIVKERRMWEQSVEATRQDWKMVLIEPLQSGSERFESRQLIEHPVIYLRRLLRKRGSREGSITAVIPAKNCAPFLRDSVLSSVYQTRPSREVIVTVDPSEDDTETVAKELGRRFTQVQSIVNIENRGIGELRNQGTVAATSDYITFLEPNDVLNHRYFEQLGAVLDDNPDVGIVYCNYREFGEHNCLMKLPDFDSGVPLLDYMARSGAITVRKRALEEAGGFDGQQSFENWGPWKTMIEEGWKPRRINEPLYKHRILPSPDTLAKGK